MKLQIKMGKDGKTIESAVFKTFGCGSAIASSSLATEMIKGKTLDEALSIKNTEISSHLKLPPVKQHCSMLAEDAVKVHYVFKFAFFPVQFLCQPDECTSLSSSLIIRLGLFSSHSRVISESNQEPPGEAGKTKGSALRRHSMIHVFISCSTRAAQNCNTQMIGRISCRAKN